VVALADLLDCHPDSGCCRPWGDSAPTHQLGGGPVVTVHHLVLDHVVPLRRPVPARGALGLWTLPSDVADAVLTQPVDPQLSPWADVLLDATTAPAPCYLDRPEIAHA